MLRNALIALMLTLSLPAVAHDYQVADIHIDHPWAREMSPVAPTGAAYFTLENRGAQGDRLLRVSTPVAGRAELHEHVHEDGLMKMRHVPSVEVPAKGKVAFAPMGYHVMLMEVRQPLQAGQKVPLTLYFEQAGSVEVQVVVEKDVPGQHHH